MSTFIDKRRYHGGEASAWLEALTFELNTQLLMENLIVGGAGGRDPGYSNSWGDYADSDFTPVRVFCYRRLRLVWLCGCISSGTIGAAAFTLPTAYRPYTNLIFGTWSNSGASELRVNSNGSVVPNTGGNTWFSIACGPWLLAG